MKGNNFVRTLPPSYKLAKKMDAKDLSFGLLLTLGSLILFVLALIPVLLPLFLLDEITVADALWNEIHISAFIFLGGTLVYVILHELTHGAVYKAMTGEKLTFGISWNCAFCGVPNIYIYRKTSIIATYAPFVLFTIILIPAMIIAYCFNIAIYIGLALIFATHISGCIGDLYMGHVLLFKYKSPYTLVNDTGPCVTVFTIDPHYVG